MAKPFSNARPGPSAMALHPGEEIGFDGHPSWRATLSFHAGAIAGAVAVGALVAFVLGVVPGVVLGGALVAAALAVGVVRRRAIRYVVTNKRLYVSRGMVAPRARETRIARVHAVAVAQTSLDRIARVGTVSFPTAGADDTELRFVGIAAPDRVVAIVDAARRRAAERIAEPRFAHRPGTTRSG
jgi:uncharacterized membrane protein YdbT with pleckstrin-like domain